MVTGTEDPKIEWLKCKTSAAYFIDTYCYIYDAALASWVPFKLWPEQLDVLDDLERHRLLCVLKARQLGLTWLILCYILWRMIFHPAFTALVFSRREVEAIYLLSKDRLRGIYARLPEWAQVRQVLTDSAHVLQFSNGSVTYGFPTSAGDSYTAGFVLVDEADLVPDLERLLEGVKPTIDGGGQMVLLSRVDKSKPSSVFKRTYVGAKAGKNGWHPVFLPWMVRPERTQAWYDAQKADILSRTGSLDNLYQQYPSTDEEALLPPTADRRIPFAWIQQCYEPLEPFPDSDKGIDIPFIKVWRKPTLMGAYAVVGDPAEGNPTSDDSVIDVYDMNNGEQCCTVAGKIEPGVLASYMATLSSWYNNAPIMPERNNHGHAVILSLDETYEMSCLPGWDGRPGWATTTRGKALLYTHAVECLKDKLMIIHNEMTSIQLASIEGGTLRAPEGELDDHAVTFCLGAAVLKTGLISVEVGESPDEGYRG